MKISASWEYPKVKASEKVLNHLLVSLETPPESGQDAKQPIAVVLVLDKSWSMNGIKMDSTVEAASSFIHWLTRKDSLGIVTYAADVQVLQNLSQLTEKKSIDNRLRSISVGTSTNLSGGWLQGLHMLENAPAECFKRVILLTDGIATMGIQEDEKLIEIAQRHFEKGISTTTIGFGEDFNEKTLREISKAGGGNFYFIDSPEKTSDIFFREFGTLGNLYAQTTELKLKLAPGLRFLELVDDLPYAVNDRELVVSLGDMRNDDIRNLAFAIEVEADKAAFKEPVIQCEVFYYDVDANFTGQRVNHSISLDEGKQPKESNPEVMQELLISWAGKTMLEASRISENDVDAAIEILENMVGRIRKHKNINNDVLEPLEKRLESVQKRLRENAAMARKQLMATGTSELKRISGAVQSNVPLHNNIFEYAWKGELDLYNTPELKNTIQTKMQDGYRYIVLDFTETAFIDSSAIGALIQISNWVTRRGGLLVIAHLQPTVEKIFQITQLYSFIPVTNDIEEGRKVIDAQIKRLN